MALAFTTGSEPGSPRQTGQTWVFGSAPNAVEQPQNIFDAVFSSTCTSSPSTGSYAASASSYGDHGALIGPPPGSGSGPAAGRPSAAPAPAPARRRPGRAGRRPAAAPSPAARPAARPPAPARPGTTALALPARLDGMVHRSFMYMASGSSTFSPIRNAVTGVDGETSTSTCSKAAVEVAADQGAHLLGLAVVGVVVAAGQRVGAEDDPPLHLGAEAGLPGRGHHLLGAVRRRRRRPAARSASRRTWPGWRSTSLGRIR